MRLLLIMLDGAMSTWLYLAWAYRAMILARFSPSSIDRAREVAVLCVFMLGQRLVGEAAPPRKPADPRHDPWSLVRQMVSLPRREHNQAGEGGRRQ